MFFLRSSVWLFFRLGRIALIAGLVAVLAAALPRDGRGQDGTEAAVIAVRVGLHDTTTRLVLDVSAPTRFRVFTLGKPYRLVVDLPPVEWHLADEMTMGKGGPIAAFRFGAFTADTSRLVVDLRRPVKIQKAFALAPKGKVRSWRLVVDLAPVSEEEFERLPAPQRSAIVMPGAGRGKSATRGARSQDTQPRDTQPRNTQPRGARPVIVLDPGHGGVDKGTTSAQGVHEKAVVLAFARVLRQELLKTKRYKVLLTRRGDYYVPLRKRYDMARRAGAELFLSLHADSNPFRKTRGLSVYTLSERASDKEAEALARRENHADVIAGVKLEGESNQVANILIDLAQRQTMSRSGRFAAQLVASLKPEFTLLERAHRYAGFAVLKAPDVPSVLVELGYLSNRADARLLGSARYRARLAKRMVRAVDVYFNSLRGARRDGK